MCGRNYTARLGQRQHARCGSVKCQWFRSCTHPSTSFVALGLSLACVKRAGGGGADKSVPRLVRKSRTKLNRLAVQLYTTDVCDETVVGAARAGFFVFGSEFEFPGAPLE
jgi:hypothetical protein